MEFTPNSAAAAISSSTCRSLSLSPPHSHISALSVGDPLPKPQSAITVECLKAPTAAVAANNPWPPYPPSFTNATTSLLSFPPKLINSSAKLIERSLLRKKCSPIKIVTLLFSSTPVFTPPSFFDFGLSLKGLNLSRFLLELLLQRDSKLQGCMVDCIPKERSLILL